MSSEVTASDLEWFASAWTELLRPGLRLVSSQPEHHVDRRGTNRRARKLYAIDGTAERWTLHRDRLRAAVRDCM